jgi:hypothetical protein
MFEFSGISYQPKRHAFIGLRFGRRLAFLLSGKQNMAFGNSEMRMVMAKIIEFYIPQRFQRNVKWVPELRRGKVIEFPSSMTRSTSKESSAVRHQPLDVIGAPQLAYCAVAPLPGSGR